MITLLFLAAAVSSSANFSYDSCLKMADRHPDQAYEDAMSAKDEGGGIPAEHCAAVALVNLKEYGEAGRRLDELARRPGIQSNELRAMLLGQAGNAWILAGQPELAIASFTAALDLLPGEAQFLVDRARASATLKKWAQAESDLSAALTAEPGSVEALVLRASARRAQNNLKGAIGDVTQALLLEPNNVEALVERGLISVQRGNKGEARKDFAAVLAAAPNSDAAASARKAIEKIDIK
ncbi:MAG: tetratricopeptide repeat protein [Alphaproteobacteria bacterium]|nr:tetratricopeptide repeat protein [Alphaproteobacteria bacterium]